MDKFKRSKKRIMIYAAASLLGFAAAGTFFIKPLAKETGGAMAWESPVGTPSNGEKPGIATPSAPLGKALPKRQSLWEGFSMSDSLAGEGTQDHPYLISSANDLKYLAYHTACSQVDGFQGIHFQLARDISLSSDGSWLPIGFYQYVDDLDPAPFKGVFDGNGKTISNLQINRMDQAYAGLFGFIQGAEIKNLKVHARIAAGNKAGAIVGEAAHSLLSSCQASGSVRANGVLGGILGEGYDTFIQDCSNTALVIGGTEAALGQKVYAGGIAGSMVNSMATDCASDTTNGYNGIYGETAVGGIVGHMAGSQVYNCYVEGMIGSVDSKTIGGIVGHMESGKVKVCRFAGTLKVSAAGTQQKAGNFIGSIAPGTTELGDHLAYLYTDSQDKYAIHPFGNSLNGLIRTGHHIGAYSADHRECYLYSPVATPKFTKLTNQYFYEELEQGVLSLGDQRVYHWAPGKTGDPVRGYGIVVQPIDHGIISVQEAQNPYGKEIDFANPGAIAPGAKVLVHTAPFNEKDPPTYYELVEDSLRWFVPGTGEHQVIRQKGDSLSFAMPAKNIEVSGAYQAMTHGVALDKTELVFQVEHIRSGNRFDPAVAWQVTDPQQLKAQVIPQAAANKKVYWGVKDMDGAYTDAIEITEDGTVSVNRDAKWIGDRLGGAVQNQLALYPSKPIILNQDHYATATVTTQAGQKRASCTVKIKFKVTDRTYVPVSGVKVDGEEGLLEIKRILTGNRRKPEVAYETTPPRQLFASVVPEYADNQNIAWKSSDPSVVGVDSQGWVALNQHASWIQDLVQEDEKKLAANPNALSTAGGEKKAKAIAISEDGKKEGHWDIHIRFQTVDQTFLPPESGFGGSGGGGGGSSSGGGGSGKLGKVLGASASQASLGSWQQNPATLAWSYRYQDGTLATSQWAKLPYGNTQEWYAFDSQGLMRTGWFTDQDGSAYFLHDKADGRQGHMYAGWHLIGGKWHYFNEVSNGFRGALQKNGITPDGYQVDADGAWVP